MAKFLLNVVFFGACLLPGIQSHPKNPSQPLGSYLVGDPSEFHRTDGQLTTYQIVPLSSTEFSNGREKRQVSISNVKDEADKSVLSKSVSGTKKPILPNPKEPNNTLATPSNKSSQNDSNKAQMPTPGTAANKSIFVDVVPAPAANTTKSKTFPKDKSTNSTVETGASASGKNGTSGSATGTASPLPPTTAPVDNGEAPTFPSYTEDFKDGKNGTQVIQKDNHKYYNSTFFSNGLSYWVNLDNFKETVDHELLSDAHRRAATLKLLFNFPFYGHIINNVTVATGGFLYLGDQVHAWLAATQYVAPLMANFQSKHTNASVRYLSTENNFTVEWHEVHLEDAPERGSFTFQATLHKNGTIAFAFKNIAIPIQEINDTQHPVKVGLSDAYISDRTILFVKQKTIYEYHRVDLLPTYNITNGSAIIFASLPTCLTLASCQDCISQSIGFQCEWCPSTSRCSDGTDRHRQEWLTRNCKAISFKSLAECFVTRATTSPDVYHNIHNEPDGNHLPDAQEKRQGPIHSESSPDTTSTGESHGMSASGVLGILFTIALVFGGAGWVLYAYHYPHSPSGQVLIRFRPSQWRSFRRGEARYTAASIHM